MAKDHGPTIKNDKHDSSQKGGKKAAAGRKASS
jgi:hypothetical protein